MKKLLAIALIAVFTLTIAGCAGKATAPGQIKKTTGTNPKAKK
ncbi:MAG: hypothetical protein AB7E76_09910 [Deferribacterales bacterium]|jgi:PBP1b-binding outer membrane lipoprotein LpoB